ncbi:MAG: Inosose dehydratase [candidate division WS2 bacterium]|nr:Inosose dehydratase [Candidatus Psychracetigena formicireducens]
MTKISLQTFTIRKHIQKEKDIDYTFKKLKDIGINYFELAYVDFTLDNIKIIKKYLNKYNIKVLSTQIKLKTIIKNYDEMVRIHKLLNAKYIAISVIPFHSLLLREFGLKKLSTKINNLGKRLKEDGLELLFHHHNFEFIKFNNRMALDILVENFNFNYVNILSDTYWIKKGNFDVISFLKKYQGKIKGIHLRGHKYISSKGMDSNLVDSTIDFKEVINYSMSENIPYLAIEQNTNTPLKDIEKSVNYIKGLGLTKQLGGNDV